MPTTSALTTASALHVQLVQLQRERALASLTDLAANQLHIADLLDDGPLFG